MKHLIYWFRWWWWFFSGPSVRELRRWDHDTAEKLFHRWNLFYRWLEKEPKMEGRKQQ